jgi:2-polyprenyl-3-methyl-5-hydroxy-6-metoxy-1,4-benzoquinol methylase
MRTSEVIRYKNTLKDLLSLNVDSHCDLGPGRGEIAIELKKAGKKVSILEAPWDFETRTSWAGDNDIIAYKGDFFTTDFNKVISEKVDCFSLIHAIAHFRFPPQLLLEQVYKKLNSGGYFYLSTINGGSLMNLIQLAKGKAITDEVKKYEDMGEEYNTFCNPSGRYMIWDSWMHVKEYRDFELKKLFESEGFELVSLNHRNNIIEWKSRLLSSIWPHLSEEITIVGRKP